MVQKLDIHGGGKDLIFPHHENELAQIETITGTKFCNFWLHCGLVKTNNTKISKTNSNEYFTLYKVLLQYNIDTIKLSLLDTHYKNCLNYSLKKIKNNDKKIHNYYKIINKSFITNIFHKCCYIYLRFFYYHINNNLNISSIIKILFNLIPKIKCVQNRIKYFYMNLLFILTQNLGIGYNIKKNSILIHNEIIHIIFIQNFLRLFKNYILGDYLKKLLF